MNDPTYSDDLITSPQTDYDSLRFVSRESSCPYLPDLQSRTEAFAVERLEGATYERMLARGFRRSGRVLYRPRCRACCECRQIRVPVEQFSLTRSMRRVWRRNSDVCVSSVALAPSHEKYAMFVRYLDAQHDDTMSRDYASFQEFLYFSPMETREYCYHLGKRLVGVSIVDRCPTGLSAVYMYFDPDHRARSLGTFSVLWEIDRCRREHLAFYYLGYYIAGTKTMSYKARFRPNEVLVADDRWERFGE